MITEKQYLEYLIKQYQNLIYSICLKSVGNPFDAEDLTQEVFLSAYKNLSRFDGNYEKAWLSKIAVRKCLDYLKAAWTAKYSNRRHLLFPDSGQAILSRR
ncbi:sigma-70 family RNA polymerase sigma factor [Blautia wexlerae]|nr:sigma-70 family RNA polymerase sigma factor [Blautia wexlerae]